ncbi:AcrR family transcriptional regulator [Salinibacterium sp. CAN_S4]|uniref:TetR-like C-terminal domain-containing protein n=1 Tax=Salinibacterium sp. CAN_S4 TaxID=2787727 RepID=UPI0018EFA909
MARAGLTPARIIAAAAELADATGFDSVSMSAVARHFDVKDASLYAHVRSLQELRSGVAVLSLAELADQVGAALAGRAGRDALLAFANAYRSYAMDHPGRYASTQMTLEPDVAEKSAARRHAEMTRAILRGYALSEPDETDAVRLLHATFHGYVLLERSGGFSHGTRSAAASWESALNTLHFALSHWPSN